MAIRTEYHIGKHYGAARWWKVFLDDVLIGTVDLVRPGTYICRAYPNNKGFSVKATKRDAFAHLKQLYLELKNPV